MLNAAKVQEEWRNKRKSEDDGSEGKPKKRQKTGTDSQQGSGRGKGKSAAHNLSILPGESLTRFNRCVTSSLNKVLLCC